MTEAEEITAAFSGPKDEPIDDEHFDVEDGAQELTSAGLEAPSSLLLVDQAGNVLGDLSMSLDSSQMSVFITHVAKASDCPADATDSVIELSEVNKAQKRKRREEDEDSTAQIKNWLTEFQEKVNNRLKILDEKASSLDLHCQQLNQKTQNLATQVNKLTRSSPAVKGRNGTIIVGLPPSSNSDDVFPIISSVYSGPPTYQLMTQNSEDEYPEGSWLGDPTNPETRVRCPIPENDLNYLTKTSPTGEKLALTLLDYLFDRETQACSNISGNSKHGKKQLDPLKIYGIKCHVIHHFAVDESTWQKIKLNLDSKCRTAFRRKLKGMPLTVKAFKDGRGSGRGVGDSAVLSSDQQNEQDVDSKDEDGELEDGSLSRLPSLREEEDVPVQKSTVQLATSQRTYSKLQPRLLPKMCLEDEEDETAAVLSLMEAEGDGQDTIPVTIQQNEKTLSLPLSQLYGEPQVLFASHTSQLIQTEQGDFQLLQATPEQLAQIQQGHSVQILATTSAPDAIQPDTCSDSC